MYIDIESVLNVITYASEEYTIAKKDNREFKFAKTVFSRICYAIKIKLKLGTT
jgi:hypothetical protein